ncbi:hypothetical protein GCM10023091_41690 [Ravibacter arvi]|uniref:Uncharacterized protein n=1 Tax=Ravibacter arvi TaxID=2051041 RepID=A0ABP8MCG2_9BACT
MYLVLSPLKYNRKTPKNANKPLCSLRSLWLKKYNHKAHKERKENSVLPAPSAVRKVQPQSPQRTQRNLCAPRALRG